jgi:hypothetical protein
MKEAKAAGPRESLQFVCLAFVALILAAFLIGGCAMTRPQKPSALSATGRGTVMFLDKYEFVPPPSEWRLMKNLEGGDFEFGFLKIEKGDFPSQTTFIYDDEPFGSSPDLERRAEQYCTRFLFNTGMFPKIQKKEKTEVRGLPALALNLGGENAPHNEKALSKVYLVKRGERIISFVCTQWRPLNGSFDPEGFARFETFVRSFSFLKPDFYEELKTKIDKLKR